ncbi:hypothetical protein [Solirubrobacter soli]|uniref:hypothetical protein n=1 Tax=Solirubrobacter soli TaxID=363832 RepID=UPI0004176750|nr:hypothetical protein [Solirubrobacter soli]
MVRVLAGSVIATALAFGHAEVAGAQELTICQSMKVGHGDPSDPAPFQRMLAERRIDVAQVLIRSAETALGAQYGYFWMNDARQGWSVAVTPGTLDPTAAKAAIADEIRARLAPDQAAFVNERLSVWATPYTGAELQALAMPLLNALMTLDQGWGLSGAISCVAGETPGVADGWRITATLYTGETEPSTELVANAAAIAAPYGDKVRVNVIKGDGRLSPGAATVAQPLTPTQQPAPATSVAAPKVARYASLPRTSRCLRGRTLTVKARRDASLVALTVEAPARTVTLKPGHQVRVRLKTKRTKLTLKVTTRDGGSASRVFRFRRC